VFGSTWGEYLGNGDTTAVMVPNAPAGSVPNAWTGPTSFPAASFGPQPSALFQVQPNNRVGCNTYNAQTPHTNLINVALADGSVRHVAAGISHFTWFAIFTPHGEEVLASDW
jgi:prepilin-type processing-associated H-X9-DG protein